MGAREYKYLTLFVVSSSDIRVEYNVFVLLLFRGRTPEYYSKAIGPFLASSVAKVRDTFQCGSDGLETNV